MSPPESLFDGCFQHIEAALNDLKAARAISARATGQVAPGDHRDAGRDASIPVFRDSADALRMRLILPGPCGGLALSTMRDSP
jgi:hypothetical protein